MGLIDAARDAIKLVDKANNLDLYKRLVDLQVEAVELTEQLKGKDERIAHLEDALLLKGKLVCKGSVYFVVDDGGNFTDGPFCTKCFDVDHNKCRIVPRGRIANPDVWCLRCKVPFTSLPAMTFLREHQ
jgi:hypothetical protein